MNPTRRKRIDELETQRQVIIRKLDEIDEESRRLWLEESIETHPCSCVRLNRDIGVTDMPTATQRRRHTFDFGLVAQLISADRDCPLCLGSGKPEDTEEGIHAR